MWLRCGLVAGIVALAAARAAASTFMIDSSAFLNGGLLPGIDAAAAGGCGGRNISPPLRLTGAPGGVRSFAVVTVDTDAGGGHGFVHWVAYGIAPAMRALPPGFGTQASPAFTGGRNDAGTTLYFGPCPPAGDSPHHYVFTVYALDLAPGRLPPGLTRAAFLRAIASHRLAQSQVTARFGR
jgi:Raf kinase inhibitor-like YbhB/YbcL family protein